VRVVAATNRDLRAMVAAGNFRQDLYYRLAVFRVHVAPLRERPEDIPLLVEHLLGEVRARGRTVGQPTPAAMRVLVKRAWRGNVRELRNALERAAVLAGTGPIEAEHLETSDDGGAQTVGDSSLLLLPLKEAKAKFAAIYAREAIRRSDGSVPDAAKRAGVTRQTLYRILSNEPE
jgi:DNA-binding NtrC family response regulator